jgi:hypothetical protein
VKLKDAIWPTLFLLTLLSGCHKHAFKVTYLVAPAQDLAIAYAEPGATIEWYADQALGDHGSPFTVYTNLPCREGSGTLSSNSKHTVTCHLKPGETGSYAISFNRDSGDKKTKGSVGAPPTVMHVGPCTGCKVAGSSKGIASPQKNSIVLDCNDTNQSRARPSSVTVSVGDPLSWTYAAGHYPPQFTVTLPAGICSAQTTTITSDGGSCTAYAPTGQPVDYDIEIPSCTGGKGNGSILINPN